MTVVDGQVKFEADYGNFNDEDQNTIAEGGQFQIQNSGNTNETVTVTVQDLPSGYTAEPIGNIAIAAGATQSVLFTINTPHSKDGGESRVGTVVLSNAAGTELTRADLIQDTESMLRLRDFEVRYVNEDGKSEKEDINENEEEYTLSENVKPGSDFILKIEVENLLDREYKRKNTLEQITVTIDLSDDELFTEDIDGDEFDISDVDAEDKDKLTLEFTLSEEIDEDDYDIDVTIEAEDEEGSKYRIEKKIKFEVKRERDDVRFTRLQTAPSKITSCDANFNVDVEIKNFGTRDQTASRVSLVSPDLGINKNENKIVVAEFSDDDNDWSEIFTFPIPSGKREGTYLLEARVFIRDDDLVHQQNVDIVLEGCERQQDSQPEANGSQEEQEETATQQPSTTTPPPQEAPSQGAAATANTSNGVVRTVEDPYRLQDVVIGIIIVAIVLIIALIIVLIIKFQMKIVFD